MWAMKRTFMGISLAAAAVGAALTVVPAAPASADTENCVSHAEWDSATGRALNPTQVEAIFDVYGVYAGENDRGYKRRYNLCDNWTDAVGVIWFAWSDGDSYDWTLR